MTMQAANRGSVSLARDLRFVFGVLWRRAWLIALCVAVALGCGLVYLQRSPKIFAAKTVIQIEQEERKVVKIEGIQSADLKTLEVLKTYEQSIVSPEVLLRVIHNHNLAANPGFLPEVNGSTSDNLLQEALSRHIEAKIRRGTRLIDITVEHRDPMMAQKIAEYLVPEFSLWNFEATRAAGGMANRFLSEEAQRLKARLATSEEAVQAFRDQNEAVSLEEKQNVTAEKLKELNLRVSEAKSTRLKLDADCAEIKNAAKDLKTLLRIPGIANAPAIAEIQKSISEKEAQFATLSERYKFEHPKFIQAKSELDKLKLGLEQTVHKTAEVLASAHEGAVLTEKSLEQALVSEQRLAVELNHKAIPYATLTREMESDRALYESVLTRLKETDVTRELAQDAVRVVSRPLLPHRPVKPRKAIVLALTLIAGLCSGCAIAFLLHATDNTLQTLDDAEAQLGLRLLGEIPKLPGRSRSANKSPVLLANDPGNESFRTLRTSLSLAGNVLGRKTFLFTSAHQGEGKTFCSINCAMSFAQLGLRTLLIDADFRLPQVDRAFFSGATIRGLKGLTGSTPEWERSIQRTHVPELSVLSLSALPELLAGDAFEQLLARVSDQYDRIVIDTAPVHLVSDTLLLARHVHAVCLVIRAGQTPASDVHRATQRLEASGAPLVGFVWNQVKTARQYYYRRAEPSYTSHSSDVAERAEAVLTRIEPHLRPDSTSKHPSPAPTMAEGRG